MIEKDEKRETGFQSLQDLSDRLQTMRKVVGGIGRGWQILAFAVVIGSKLRPDFFGLINVNQQILSAASVWAAIVCLAILLLYFNRHAVHLAAPEPARPRYRVSFLFIGAGILTALLINWLARWLNFDPPEQSTAALWEAVLIMAYVVFVAMLFLGFVRLSAGAARQKGQRQSATLGPSS